MIEKDNKNNVKNKDDYKPNLINNLNGTNNSIEHTMPANESQYSTNDSHNINITLSKNEKSLRPISRTNHL